MNIKPLLSKLTIYHYMISFLVILSLVSVFFYDFGTKALVPVLVSVLTTSILDLLINYFRFKTLEFPYSAFISGLFIGGLLTQNLQWYIYFLAGLTAVLSKYILKIHGRHIFNPANLGIFAVFLLFKASNSWWIVSPAILVIIFGIFIILKLKRLDLSLSFLLAYYLIHFALLLKDASPLIHFSNLAAQGSTIFFFAMFMLIEPKTHPAARRARIFYGILVALMLIGVELKNPAFGLPFVLVIANLFVPILNKMDVELRRKHVPKQE